ncbi:hypothetical protein QTP88_011919 [Uroleucon formosanum]
MIYFVRLTVKEGKSNVKRIGLSYFDLTYLSARPEMKGTSGCSDRRITKDFQQSSISKKKKLPVPADLQYNYDSSLRYRFTSPSLVGTFGTVRANFSGDDAVRNNQRAPTTYLTGSIFISVQNHVVMWHKDNRCKDAIHFGYCKNELRVSA